MRPSTAPRRSGRSPASPTPTEPPALPPLYQRILFPASSPPKPPRILHSSAHTALDPLLLDLIALSLRAYVTSWYNSGISRDPDKAFLQAVTAVVVHVVQALEVRLATVDWTEVLVAELPELLAQHYRDWDLAVKKAGGGAAHNLSPELVFHRLQPHIAISLVPPIASSSPEGERTQPTVDKVYLRTLVDHLLKLLLPPADYRAETERGIVREILVGVVFGTVYGRVAQPWFIHGLIARQLETREAAGQARAKADRTMGTLASSPVDRILVALSKLPGAASVAWSFVASLAFLSKSTSVPAHYASQPPLSSSLSALAIAMLPTSSFLAQLVHFLSLPLTFFASLVDAFLVHFITTRLTTDATAKLVLEGAIRGMFPNNGWPAPKEDDPDEVQQEELKRRCEEALARALPVSAASLLDLDVPPSAGDPRLPLACHLLRPFASHVANVHLLVLIVDLVVGKLFPELLTSPDD
ncbi:hypothetical protein JCM10207_002765 [Rhodosporidiobolus poonsookiae]